MVRLVLEGYMKEHPQIYARMVAAYVIGYTVDRKWLADNPHLKFARRSDDYGVIVSYNTEGPRNASHHNFVVLDGAVSINPINWRRDDTYAPACRNLGSWVEKDGRMQKVMDLADAQVDTMRGVVRCTTAPVERYGTPAALSALFGPYSYHLNDIGLYYFNLRRNAEDRIAAYRAAHGSKHGSKKGFPEKGWTHK